MITKKASFKYAFILSIFFLSILVGLIYLLQIENRDLFFYQPHSGTDMFTFLAQAMNIYKAPAKDIALKIPLYANFFLPIIFIVFGPNLFLVRMIQVIFGAASNILIFKIAKGSFNQTAAIIATVISLLYSRFYIYQGVLLSETLAIFCLLCLTFFLQQLRKKKSICAFLSISIFLSLLILLRPKFLLVSFFIFGWIFFILRNDKKKLLSSVTLILLVLILFIRPKAITDMAVKGKALFKLYNSECIYQQQALDIFIWPKQTPLTALKAETERRSDGAFLSKISSENISRLFKILMIKIRLFFKPQEEIYDNFPPRYYRNISFIPRVLPFSWGIVLPLALAGIWLGTKYERNNKLIYIMLSAYIGSILLFQVVDRYRLLSEPYFIIFAAFTLYYVGKKFLTNKPLALKLSGILLIAELLFNFQAVERKLFMILHPFGLHHHTQETLVIRDSPAKFSSLKYKSILKDSQAQIIKHFVIKESLENFKGATILIDGYCREPFNLQLIINKTLIANNWSLACIEYPFLGTLKLKVSPRHFRRGLNTLSISTQTPNTFCVFIDTRYDFNRSAFFTPENGRCYYDLGSESILGDGEYRIALEFKK